MSGAVRTLSRSIEGFGAVVTGAGSGMGRATAHVFAQAGALVAVTDFDGERARMVAAEIEAAGGRAQAWRLDVCDPQAITQVIGEAAATLGRLDILVNNAGISTFRPIDDPDFEDAWSRSVATMLTAHQRTVRAALPHLRQASHPRIVNIASTEALGATAGNAAYASAKAGVVGLTRALAVELGPEGITVNCICPGPILTGMTGRFAEEDRAVFARRRTALRRYGDPEEVAHVTLSLCLPASSYVTGAIIPVDGGLMARNA